LIKLFHEKKIKKYFEGNRLSYYIRLIFFLKEKFQIYEIKEYCIGTGKILCHLENYGGF
jgi:hypothetical protein